MKPSQLPSPTAELRRRMESAFSSCVAQDAPVLVLALRAFDRTRLLAARECDHALGKALLDLLSRSTCAPLFAYAAGSEILAMVVGGDAGAEQEICSSLLQGAEALSIRDGDLTLRARLCLGIARLDKRGVDLDTLLLVAREGSSVAEFRGGGCAVHTMLYDSLQRTVDRARAEAELSGEPVGWWAACDPELTLQPDARAPASLSTAPSLEFAQELPEEDLDECEDGPWVSFELDGPLRADGEDEEGELFVEFEADGLFEVREEPRPETPAEEAITIEALDSAHLSEGLRSIVLEHARGWGEPALEDRLAAMAEDIAARALEEARRELLGGALTRAIPSEPSPETREEIDRLQRRIDKLMKTLAQTERRLAEARAQPFQDPGVPSRFREVQGLSEDQGDYGRRVQLMAAIFEANLELARLSGGRRPDVA